MTEQLQLYMQCPTLAKRFLAICKPTFYTGLKCCKPCSHHTYYINVFSINKQNSTFRSVVRLNGHIREYQRIFAVYSFLIANISINEMNYFCAKKVKKLTTITQRYLTHITGVFSIHIFKPLLYG